MGMRHRSLYLDDKGALEQLNSARNRCKDHRFLSLTHASNCSWCLWFSPVVLLQVDGLALYTTQSDTMR